MDLASHHYLFRLETSLVIHWPVRPHEPGNPTYKKQWDCGRWSSAMPGVLLSFTVLAVMTLYPSGISADIIPSDSTMLFTLFWWTILSRFFDSWRTATEPEIRILFFCPDLLHPEFYRSDSMVWELDQILLYRIGWSLQWWTSIHNIDSFDAYLQ